MLLRFALLPLLTACSLGPDLPHPVASSEDTADTADTADTSDTADSGDTAVE